MIWMIIILILIIIEYITPLELTTVWFLPATIVAFILDMLKVGPTIIITIFIILVIIGSICMYIYFKKRIDNKEVFQERYRGIFTVEPSEDNKNLRIKVKDIYYFVIPEGESNIKIGDKVESVGMAGNKIIVRKIESNEVKNDK